MGSVLTNRAQGRRGLNLLGCQIGLEVIGIKKAEKLAVTKAMGHIKACHLIIGVAVKLIGASLSRWLTCGFHGACHRADKGLLARLGCLALLNVPAGALDIVGQMRVGFD